MDTGRFWLALSRKFSMGDSFQVPDFSQMSVAERIIVVEQIWDSIAAEQQEVALTPAQEAELDRRLESYRRSPTAGSSWEEVKARIQAKK
jgi:putative addiction module component (TIGR02574 family)